jgi:hypothetical protein
MAAFAVTDSPEQLSLPSSTPIPATLPPFAGGLGMLGLFVRRRQQKAIGALESRNTVNSDVCVAPGKHRPACSRQRLFDGLLGLYAEHRRDKTCPEDIRAQRSDGQPRNDKIDRAI